MELISRKELMCVSDVSQVFRNVGDAVTIKHWGELEIGLTFVFWLSIYSSFILHLRFMVYL